MARDIAIASFVLALVLFLIGVACGTSKELVMFICWAIAAVLVLVALVMGARAVLLDAFPTKQ